jgi:hypothetical protein
VALGDTYQATLNHDLSQGALHVPLTSTNRHNFGTGELQVNQLASRMLDSSLNNVGTYGVRFDVTFNLSGTGPHQLVLSHPTPNGRTFTAFRGSIGIASDEGYQEVHVGMKSGESLSLASLNLKPGQNNPVKVSLVYPADATPGHLLSVVPDRQLAQVRERQILIAKAAAESQAVQQRTPPPAPPGLAVPPQPSAAIPVPSPRPPAVAPGWLDALPPIPPVNSSQLPPPGAGFPSPERMSQALLDRYQQAVDAQQHYMNSLMGR